VKFRATVKINKKPLRSEEFREYLWKYLSCDCALKVENPRCENGRHVAGPFSDPMTSYDRQQA